MDPTVQFERANRRIDHHAHSANADAETSGCADPNEGIVDAARVECCAIDGRILIKIGPEFDRKAVRRGTRFEDALLKLDGRPDVSAERARHAMATWNHRRSTPSPMIRPARLICESGPVWTINDVVESVFVEVIQSKRIYVAVILAREEYEILRPVVKRVAVSGAAPWKVRNSISA